MKIAPPVGAHEPTYPAPIQHILRTQRRVSSERGNVPLLSLVASRVDGGWRRSGKTGPELSVCSSACGTGLNDARHSGVVGAVEAMS